MCSTDAPDDVLVMRDYGPLAEILETLYTDHGITSLLVEGGAEVLRSFMDEGLWDRIRIERSPLPIHGKVPAPSFSADIRIKGTSKTDNHDIIEITRQ